MCTAWRRWNRKSRSHWRSPRTRPSRSTRTARPSRIGRRGGRGTGWPWPSAITSNAPAASSMPRRTARDRSARGQCSRAKASSSIRWCDRSSGASVRPQEGQGEGIAPPGQGEVRQPGDVPRASSEGPYGDTSSVGGPVVDLRAKDITMVAIASIPRQVPDLGDAARGPRVVAALGKLLLNGPLGDRRPRPPDGRAGRRRRRRVARRGRRRAGDGGLHRLPARRGQTSAAWSDPAVYLDVDALPVGQPAPLDDIGDWEPPLPRSGRVSAGRTARSGGRPGGVPRCAAGTARTTWASSTRPAQLQPMEGAGQPGAGAVAGRPPSAMLRCRNIGHATPAAAERHREKLEQRNRRPRLPLPSRPPSRVLLPNLRAVARRPLSQATERNPPNERHPEPPQAGSAAIPRIWPPRSSTGRSPGPSSWSCSARQLRAAATGGRDAPPDGVRPEASHRLDDRGARRRRRPEMVQTTADLTPPVIAELLRTRRSDLSPHTVRTLLRVVRVACNSTVESGRLRVSPFPHLKIGRLVRVGRPQGHRRLSREELRKLLDRLAAEVEATQGGWRITEGEASSGPCCDGRVHGPRRSEALRLHVSDVDLPARVVHVQPRVDHRLKSERSAAKVPIPLALIPIIEGWLPSRVAAPPGTTLPPEVPWLFPNLRGEARGSMGRRPESRSAGSRRPAIGRGSGT